MIFVDQIASVLLAAGQSRRFGTDDKLLADLDGRPLVLHAAELIVALKPPRMIAVCSAPVGKLLEPLGFELIVNDEATSPMSASLALGIAAAATGKCDAALVTLGDMPFVTLQHLQQLLKRWNPPNAPVVGTTWRGTSMPPALFARSKFTQLSRITGDHGAKDLLATADLVEAPPEQLADVDTIDDLLRLRRKRAVSPDACRA